MVTQKDATYFRAIASASSRLRHKFATLFARVPNRSTCSCAPSEQDQSPILPPSDSSSWYFSCCSALSELSALLYSTGVSPSQSVRSLSGQLQSQYSPENASNSAESGCPEPRSALSDLDSLSMLSDSVLLSERSVHSVCRMANTDILNRAFLDSTSSTIQDASVSTRDLNPVELAALPDPEVAIPLPWPPIDHDQDNSLIIDQDPLVPIPLPGLPEIDVNTSLRALTWGQNIPTISENDPRLIPPIVNLSGFVLTADQLEVLSFSLNFRETPKQIPRLKLMARTEAACH